jgi:hypothetical protein
MRRPDASCCSHGKPPDRLNDRHTMPGGGRLSSVSLAVMTYWLSYDNRTIGVPGGRDQLLVT